MSYNSPNKVPVPSENGIDNNYIQDVIGNKGDNSFSNASHTPSIIGHLTAGYHHVHDSAKVHPPLADPITLTAAIAAWTYGDPVEIVAANAINKWLDIHWIISTNPSAAGDYELRLKNGDTIIGTIAFGRSSVQDRGSVYLPIQIPPQPANSQITAELASGNETADTCQIKIYYHTYPDIVSE